MLFTFIPVRELFGKLSSLWLYHHAKNPPFSLHEKFVMLENSVFLNMISLSCSKFTKERT